MLGMENEAGSLIILPAHIPREPCCMQLAGGCNAGSQGQWAGWRTKVAGPIPEEGPLQVLWDGAFHLLDPVVKLARLRGEGRCPVLCVEGSHRGALHDGVSLHTSRALVNGLRTAPAALY